MKREKLVEMYKRYNLTADDIYQHKHYTIITRSGIDKIQGLENIVIDFEMEHCSPEYCCVKAEATLAQRTIQTFGSAKYGGKEWIEGVDGKKGKWKEDGNTTTWYIAEMAEKRAMSRAVLKLTGFYELGVFGEDESEDFKRR